jgi:hypothetical protein
MQEWQKFMNEIAAAADSLGETSLAELTRRLAESALSLTLNVLVTARPDCGGWPVAVHLAEAGSEWGALPCDRFPLVDLKGGAHDSAVIEHGNGMRELVGAEQIRGAAAKFDLLDADPNNLPKCLDLTLKQAPGANVEVRWVRLDLARTEDQWRFLLSGVDFLLLVSREEQLLTADERKFLACGPIGQFGLSRCALILQHNPDLTESHRGDIRAALVRYFSGCEAEPMTIEHGPASIDLANFQAYLKRSFQPMKLESLAVTARSTLELLKGAYQRRCQEQERDFAARESERREREQQLKERSAAVETLEATLEFYLQSVMQRKYEEEIRAFGAALSQDLDREIRSANEMSPLIRHIPHYLADTWRSYVLGLLARMQKEINGQLKVIFQDAAARGILADAPGLAAGELRTSLYSGLRRTPVSAGSSHWTMLVGIAGITLIWGNPLLGVSLLGASKALQWVVDHENRGIQRGELSDAARQACLSLESQARKEVARWIESAVGPAREALRAACGAEEPAAPPDARTTQVLEQWQAGLADRFEAQAQQLESQCRQQTGVAAAPAY